MDPTIFRRDGIRGVFGEELVEEDAWKIGSGSAQFLRSLLTGYQRGQANAQSLCVGRDMRSHSEALARALIEGMNAAGANVIDIGVVDTPQMYFAINHLGTCGGVQVTGSHDALEYNGFKISGLGAAPVGEDTGLKDIKHIAMALLHTKASGRGVARERDLGGEYRNHVLKFMQSPKRRLKIAVDASNGMAGKMMPLVFSGLGLEILPLNFEHRGVFKHAPEPVVEENLGDVKEGVAENGCDFGFCFDGDADRLVMVDENGETVRCDLMTALMVPYFLSAHPKSTVVYDLRSSRVVAEETIKHGGTPRRERAGHAFVRKAMRDSHAIFGGELSGHFHYRDNYCTDSAAITVVHMINIIGQGDTPVSGLVRPLQRYRQSGEIRFAVEDRKARMDELAKRYGDGQIDYLDGVTIGYKDWWFNCRPGNTEGVLKVNVEAKTEELLQEKVSEIKALLGGGA